MNLAFKSSKQNRASVQMIQQLKKCRNIAHIFICSYTTPVICDGRLVGEIYAGLKALALEIAF